MSNLIIYIVTMSLMITPYMEALSNDILFDFSPYLYEEDEKREESKRVPFDKIVSIQRKTFHICTGIVISKRWILTTAAYFYFTRESMRIYRVMLGTAGIKRGLVSPIRYVVVNPEYQFGQPQSDLAALMLVQDLPFSSVFSAFRFMTPSLERVKYGSTSSAREHHNHEVTVYNVTGWPSQINPLKNESVYFDTYFRETFHLTRQYHEVPHPECMHVLPKESAYDYFSSELFCLRLDKSSVNLPGAAVYRDDYLFGVVSTYWPDLPANRFNEQRYLYVTRINSPDIFSWLRSI